MAPRPHAMPLVALLVAVLVPGCVSDTPPLPDAPEDALPAMEALLGPLMTRTGCSGYNAILFTDGAAMRPFVPANWTFTAPWGRQDFAILRVHVVGCAEGLHLILSTPMQPDEASTHHHDNPDVILAVYSDHEATLANWSRLGAAAHLATIDWQEGPTGDTVHVATDDGLVLHLVSLDPHYPPNTSYTWPATYAIGTTNITWAWGHENASSRRVLLQEVTLGAASPLPGITTTQWFVEAWVRFDVQYEEGTPNTA